MRLSWVEEKVKAFHDDVQFNKTKIFKYFVRTVINFLHNRCIDFKYEIIGDENANLITHSWVGDF